MKNILLLAALSLFTTMSAQEKEKELKDVPSGTRNEMNAFSNLDLTSQQKTEIKSLLSERKLNREKNFKDHQTSNPKTGGVKPTKDAVQLSDEVKDSLRKRRSDFHSPERKAKMEKERKEFDEKVEKILTKEQFIKYKSEQEARKLKHQTDKN